jgi:hypothetical protein
VRSGSDRAVALLRVATIEGDVAQVVDQVAGARDRAERRERERRVEHPRGVVELL